MFEASDEHNPGSWVSGLLGVIADQCADSRRGVMADNGTVIQVMRTTDDGDQIVLTLTVEFHGG